MLSVAEAKRRFCNALRAVKHRGERVVVERRGRPIAAIVPLDDLARLARLERSAPTEQATTAITLGAIALASDGLLVTGNLRHFARVPGLRAEDWIRG